MKLSNFENVIKYLNYIAKEKAYISRVSKLISDISTALNSISNILDSNKLGASRKKEEIEKLMKEFKNQIEQIDKEENPKKRLHDGIKEFIDHIRDQIENIKSIKERTQHKMKQYLEGIEFVINFIKNSERESIEKYENYISSVIKIWEEQKGFSIKEFNPSYYIQPLYEISNRLEEYFRSLDSDLKKIEKDHKEKVDNIYKKFKDTIEYTNNKLMSILKEEIDTLKLEGISIPDFKPTIDLSGVKNVADKKLDIGPINFKFSDYAETTTETIIKIIDKGPGFLWWREILGIRYEINEEKVNILDKEATVKNLEEFFSYVNEISNKVNDIISHYEQKYKIFDDIQKEIENSFEDAKRQYEDFISSILSYANNALRIIDRRKEEQEKILNYIETIESGEGGFKELKTFWKSVYN